MQDRKRIAQGATILATLLLFACGVLHGYGGVSQVFPLLNGSMLPPTIVLVLRTVWLVVSFHWIAFGVLILMIGFARVSARRVILVLCGFVPLGDAIAGYSAVGLFIGDELLVGAALAIFLAALLFPSRQPW
jgi:hypothetical protein